MYQFSEELRKQYESMTTPLAYYQAVDEGLVALLVTDGLCAMMGLEREKLMEQSATLYEDVDDPSALSEQELNSRIYSLMAKLIRENLQAPAYEEAREVVVHYGLLDKEKNLYGISEEDGSKLGEVLFSASLE